MKDQKWLGSLCEHAGEEAFVAAVIQQPDDHLPSLVYADWLDERGDVRGSFLRLCYAMQTGAATTDELGREAELRPALTQRWLAAVRAWEAAAPAPPVDEARAYTLRGGEMVPVDDSFNAWLSGDIDQMFRALTKKTNPTDRHFVLMNFVERTYQQRTDQQMANDCILASELHIAEFPTIAAFFRKENEHAVKRSPDWQHWSDAQRGEYVNRLPRVRTFQRYPALLAERGEYERAVEVCRLAIGFGLNDGTKTGFEGRIQRITRQAQSNKP